MDAVASQDRIESATTIFRALIGGRLSERYKAVETLNDPNSKIDVPTLRTLLRRAITEDYAAGKEAEQEDRAIARTRSWLLAALGKISPGDDDATNLVSKHVHENHEPYNWARYWSLEGLIASNNAKTKAVAQSVADNDDDPMVAMLATAYLGSLNDSNAVKKLRKNLEAPQRQWFALRALRVVPIPATVPALCKIVEAAGYTDETYDAIMALANVPSHWSHAATAGSALSAAIVKMRGSPWQDGMRTGTITGLGNLKVESSSPLLIEELTDDNPAIVREAARSLEKILGIRATVIRVVEAAAKAGAAASYVYGRALRWLNREAAANELETLMQTGSLGQQDIARDLLSELGGAVAFAKLRARTDVMRQYSEILEKAEEKVRELFETSVREAQNGFQIAVIMDVVVFAVGIILLLGSAGYALVMKGEISSWVGIGLTGGTGVLGVVYGVLIANPRRQVRESVDHLMRVKMVFLAYLRRLHQADQAYSRRLLDDEPITVEQVKSYSEAVGDIMKQTLEQDLSMVGKAAIPEKPAKVHGRA